MTICGVPAGAKRANQLSMSKPGYIESSVGRSGSTEDFRLVVIASPRSLPAAIWGRPLVTAGRPMSVSPLTRAIMAAPEPLYGMWVIERPDNWCSITPARWLVVPEPLEPKLSPSLRFFDTATSSFTVRAGTDGCTHSTIGEEATCTIGARSLRASYASFGYSVTLTDNEALVMSSV